MTEMQIQDLVNECVRETDDNLNVRLLVNHGEVNKGCSRKILVPCDPFPHFRILFVIMELSGIIAHCAIVSSRAHGEN